MHNELDPHFPECYLVTDLINIKKASANNQRITVSALAKCHFHSCNHSFTALIAKENRFKEPDHE